MSRVQSRRSRGRAGRSRDRAGSHRPAPAAYTETPDAQPPRLTGHLGTAPVRRATVPVQTRGGRPAPPAGSALDPAPDLPVEAPEAPDPDLPALTAATEVAERPAGADAGAQSRLRRLVPGVWAVVVVAGLACLVLALLEVGPTLLADAGSTVVLVAYTWALAARTGGRAGILAAVAAAAAVGVLLSGQPTLRTGLAVMTCCIAAVLAVVATAPAPTYARAVRESVLAVLISGVGAMATLGLAPTISLVRFEYATLALSLLGAFAVVYRLGSGLHGLGRRGVVAVLVGGAVLVVTLLYAEALRRYGPLGTVDSLLAVVRWSREHLGAFPRPVEAVLGVPALVWGVHLRARRRQGWWVCAFGAAGTAAVANALLNPAIGFVECGLSVLYGLVVGLGVGWLVIRADLALSGGGGRGRRADERAPARPEPPRTASLI